MVTATEPRVAASGRRTRVSAYVPNGKSEVEAVAVSETDTRCPIGM
jgi:hypothetical protein